MIVHTARKRGRGKHKAVEAVEFRGLLSEADIARWAKGRLKGAGGRFVIEIDNPETGETLVASQYTVIVRDPETETVTAVIPSLTFRAEYTIDTKEDQT